ncbi:hypothetical protein D3C72_1771910 [compost metagenome]
MSSTSQRSSSAATAGALSGSFSRPALLIASRPASNCGLTSRMQCAPGSAISSAGGRASFSEMKETSETMKVISRLSMSSSVIARALRPSMLVTRGSLSMRGWIWPWPTSMATTCSAPRFKSTSVKPPVDAPISTQLSLEGSSAK